MDPSEVDEVKRVVKSLDWYHTIDLGQGIITPGSYDHRSYLQFYGLPEDLAGKTALDIGAGSGFFSFEMERRGAKVTATDLPQWYLHDFGPNLKARPSEEEGLRYLHEPFALASRVLRSKAQRKLINIYDVSPETVGTYDLVFCGSVLPHLTDPIKALWRIQSVTKEMAIVATCISRDHSTVPRAVFAGQHDGTSWWLPNRACLEAMVEVAGFKCWEWFSEFRLDFRDGRPGLDHSVIRAWNSSRETVGIEDKEDTEVESVKGRRPGRLQKWRRKLGITA